MKAKVNFSGRKKIRRQDVSVSVRSIPGAASIAALSTRLEDYQLPPAAHVYVEAYRKSEYLRRDLGPFESLQSRYEIPLDGFSSSDGVRFRLKVVEKTQLSDHIAPLLLAVADGIPIEGEGELDSDHEKLLATVPGDLNGEIWRVDVWPDGPVLTIERDYYEQRMSFVQSSWFFSLVIPSVCRQALTAALDDGYRELDSDDWRSRWLQFALGLPGDGFLPATDAEDEEVLEWIDGRTAAFSRAVKISERFRRQLDAGGDAV